MYEVRHRRTRAVATQVTPIVYLADPGDEYEFEAELVTAARELDRAEAMFGWVRRGANWARRRLGLSRPVRETPQKIQFSGRRSATMIRIVRQLDQAVDATQRLNREQANALLANLLQVINNNIPLVMTGQASFDSLQSQVNLHRWRFLRQFPTARARFLRNLQAVEKRLGRRFTIPWA